MLDVGLIGWVHVHVVLARARHVEVAVSLLGVHTEVEFRVLTERIFAIVRVLEIEIALDDVLVRSWLSFVSFISLTKTCSHFHALRNVNRVVRNVCR